MTSEGIVSQPQEYGDINGKGRDVKNSLLLSDKPMATGRKLPIGSLLNTRFCTKHAHGIIKQMPGK